MVGWSVNETIETETDEDGVPGGSVLSLTPPITHAGASLAASAVMAFSGVRGLAGMPRGGGAACAADKYDVL